MERNVKLRNLPSVEKVLSHPDVVKAVEGGVPRLVALGAARDVLGFLRRSIMAGEHVELSLESVAAAVLDLSADRQRPKIRRVINATGVVLHTNLGRAPLPHRAVEAFAEASGYCNLEYDLDSGARGSRHEPLIKLLKELTGAEDALIVNNNAAAVLLTLSALTRGREVIVSRGQLVEIGGAFRVPEVLAQSGAVLREVGTTNKTRILDYAHAIGPETGALLKVHTSNYRVMGFTEEATLEEMVHLGRRHNLWVVEDLGSGLLLDPGLLGIDEPGVAASVAAGADIVTFSGDKLLGGPQAGIIVGRLAAVETLARHPLMRAVRPDKVTLATLESVLKLYRDPRKALTDIPTLAMLSQSKETLRLRAGNLADKFSAALDEGAVIEVREDYSEAGGGSLPLAQFPTWVVTLRKLPGGVASVEANLRRQDPPVIARIKDDALIFDPRTVDDEDFDALARLVATAAGEE